MCWWLDFTMGNWQAGQLGHRAATGLEGQTVVFGWCKCAEVCVWVWCLEFPAYPTTPGCAGGLLCVVFLCACSSDFFMIHFIYSAEWH